MGCSVSKSATGSLLLWPFATFGRFIKAVLENATGGVLAAQALPYLTALQ